MEEPLQLRVGARSERGAREENQDQVNGFVSPFGVVCLVADGMGGHRGGADAARLVAQGFQQHIAQMPLDMPLEEVLQGATAAVNADVLQAGASGDASKRGLGSTVVLAALRQRGGNLHYTIGHIGDSRAYLLANGEITRLTKDHSMVQRLVDQNIVAPEDAQKHPHANVLLRALGQGAEVRMEVSEQRLLEPGARILLCSDGLWGSVAENEILEEASRTGDPEDLAAHLVELALKKGSDDNVTVQVVCANTGPAAAQQERDESHEGE